MPKVCRATSDSEILTRFWAKVQIGDDCWLWTASTIKGYGQFRLPRVQGQQPPPVYAHRFAWQLAHGPIPTGLNVCHRCDTPLCVRPDHLFLGTQQENLADARRKGRLDESRPRGTLDDAAYLDILTSDWTNVQLARFYLVHEQSIWRIRHHRQGIKTIQRVLQDQASQPQPDRARGDVLHQVFEPQPSVQLEIRGDVR